MTQALYAHMNNKRKMKKKSHFQRLGPKIHAASNVLLFPGLFIWSFRIKLCLFAAFI
jgi:hypothetical protein